MEYNVRAIPKAEFLHYVDLVTRSMQSRRSDVKGNKLIVNRVTEDYAEFDPFQKELKTHQATNVGEAWPLYDRIWLKPGRDVAVMRITAIHEISHLAEKGCSHGPKWRRVFGVALAYHLREGGVSEQGVWDEIERLAVNRYREYRQFTPQGAYNNPAEFDRKCRAEVDSIYRASRRAHA